MVSVDTRTSKMNVIWWIALFSGYYNPIVDNCGQCTCSDDLSWMACSGETVFVFPELSQSDKKLVTAIEIEDSYIFELPIMRQTDYPSLVLVKIINNINLNCDYARQWHVALEGQGTVITDCLLPPEQTTSYTVDWGSSTGQWTEQSTEYLSPQPGSRTAVLIVLIGLSCTALIGIIALLVHHGIKKGPVRTSRAETNSIYRMTTIEGFESTV